MQQRVLIVDDEPDIRELLEITLGRMNLQTTPAGDLTTARRLLEQDSFDFCLTDMKLPDGNGLELVEEIQRKHDRMPVAVITAFGSTETAVSALKAGAFDFVSKPVDLQKLRTLVQSALKLSQPAPTAEKLQEPADTIVGNSPAIVALKQQITKVARSQAPVCIYGESGSGKELVARAIHDSGPRKDKEFVAINCGAIPAELMESEFFGHKKGSFTGADQDKLGLFQLAHGGTLFLDEIADLPLLMQVKLLRAIQEKAIRPVGAHTEVPVDVRILSATHKNLAKAVESGQFRQDLFYRINVIELQVPPLRERREDLPLLVNHILSSLASANQTHVTGISADALAALQNHGFPGNVRELENMLHRACALADSDHITLQDLPELGQGIAGLEPPEPPPLPSVLDEGDFSLDKHLETIERQVIEKALQESRWNRTAAARKLGMSFRVFRYRLKKLNLDKDD
ncbi:MAG TPA: sigma-54 dependent transcriptional regulator [Candidatus Acidoferrum sp.]|nr:sigma-54 dependent transcriptional regulator [Candidatus Acidoferrum sp.]